MNYNLAMLLLFGAILLGGIAQSKVQSTFNKYDKVQVRNGKTGAQIAREILDYNGLRNVKIETIPGHLSDHYDPRARVIRLSEKVYRGSTVSAISVAAHEAGHAVQDAEGYIPLRFRNTIAPMVSFGSSLVGILILLGILMSLPLLLDIGIIIFASVLIFQLVTLPVEFDASKKALKVIEEGHFYPEELDGANKVLKAAAMTYVAATLVAAMQFLRLLTLRNRK